MKDTSVSKTVSLKLEQVRWLAARYGNVTKAMQSIIDEKMATEKSNRLAEKPHGNGNRVSQNNTGGKENESDKL